ncbi:hypothetical protein TNCV_3051611 [Trichonephila clavipes]|nr:hypothetical protein TNCV_3051611 [Trichonephila clavipes]
MQLFQTNCTFANVPLYDAILQVDRVHICISDSRERLLNVAVFDTSHATDSVIWLHLKVIAVEYVTFNGKQQKCNVEEEVTLMRILIAYLTKKILTNGY